MFGLELNFHFLTDIKKTIKYINIGFSLHNSVYDYVKSGLDDTSYESAGPYYTNKIYTRVTKYHICDSQNIKYAKIRHLSIEYMDKTIIKFNKAMINCVNEQISYKI